MPGRILIIDTVATNRIVLKVKMLAAQFAVDACDSKDEALAVIARNRPDLILMNLADAVADQYGLCRDLRQMPATSDIAIIAVGVADTSRARFAALDAGADAVLPFPVNDALLLARMRSMMRANSASEELQLREGTSRALGFEEQSAEFDGAASIALLAHLGASGQHLATNLREGMRSTIHVHAPAELWHMQGPHIAHDLFVVDASEVSRQRENLFGIVADLRARAQTRLAMQLVVVPANQPEVAAMFLDLGADDVVPESCDAAEIALRAKRLIARKRKQDRLRDTVRNGLNAAVTDPLTGLFNRRYVGPHLARLAAQARKCSRDLAVMMIDIDHFKAVNDTYGHAAGDRVLIGLADRLRENLRAIDLMARMGGEEFLVAMPGTTETDARLAADRLRELVNSTPFAIDNDGTAIKITISIGIAVCAPYRAPSDPITTICERADQALFAAKSAGRNQVAVGRSAA